jgi:hypothetical protein
MREFNLSFCNLSQNTVDDILAAFLAVTYTGPGRRTINLNTTGGPGDPYYNYPPSAAGLITKAALQALGDVVNTN